jgi:hypothetical protein
VVGLRHDSLGGSPDPAPSSLGGDSRRLRVPDRPRADEAGELYVVGLSSGTVHRLVKPPFTGGVFVAAADPRHRGTGSSDPDRPSRTVPRAG